MIRPAVHTWLRGLTALLAAFAVAFASHSLAVAAEMEKAKPPAVPGTELEHLYESPIGRMAYVARDARYLSSPSKTGRVLAIGFVDITGLDGVRTGGYEVVDAAELAESNPDLYKQLRLDERSKIKRFMIIKATNDKSVFSNNESVLQRLHAEELILVQMTKLGVQDPVRLSTIYSDYSPCKSKCSPKIPPTTDRFFAAVYRSKGYKQKLEARLGEAGRAAKADPSFQKEKAAEKARLAELKKENTKRKYETAKKTDKVFRTGQGKPCSQQNLSIRLALVSRIDAAGPDCDESVAPPDNGLIKALTDPPSGTTGGIDFSSMQLRYLSDPGDGSGLQYSFSAQSDPMHGDLRTSTGLKAAGQTSDAFFVWLSLNPRDFWVNLNPDEPDRIVDDQLGRTDAGRVLLEADLRMKKTVGELIHPHSALGRKFWGGVKGDCLSFRNWILPAPAPVRQEGDKLYILEAPLDVKMETQYLASHGQSSARSCPQQDQATEDHNEELFRSLILPKLKQAINSAPEYAALRRVYLARVAAQWYRELSLAKETTYGKLINSGDIDTWTTTDGWKPTDTFDQYVDSYTKGDFKVTDKTTRGNTTYVQTYVYGGVDLTNIPLEKISDERFTADFAKLPQNVDRSLNAPSTTDGGDNVWLGSPTPRQAAAGLGPTAEPGSVGTWALRLLPVCLLPIAVLLWRRRRRLNTSAQASPLRRAAVGDGRGQRGSSRRTP
ncbi:hypothetical protein ACFYQ5_34845 [Streptomyces sp. NPDC005794]|uniref:hypothetical protein n=1 Tax=Streptomyces sp. NPDC005794 TaxID=3364733 RepID=UPI0036CDCBC5